MTIQLLFFLKGQDVVGVGQFAFLCSGQGLSAPQRSVAVGVLQRRVVLSVAQPGEGQTQQRAHEYVYRKEDEDNINDLLFELQNLVKIELSGIRFGGKYFYFYVKENKSGLFLKINQVSG